MKLEMKNITCGEKTLIWFDTGCWLLAVVFVIVVGLTLDFCVEVVDKVTIWGCLEGALLAVVVLKTDTVEEEAAKLLVAVVGTSRMYWT